jgi:hypothetical protein
VELEPQSYRCSAHGVDLTEQVREQVAKEHRVLFRRPDDPAFRVLLTWYGSPYQLGCADSILDDH